MRILHIGDFHYKSKGNTYEQNTMIRKMIESLKTTDPIDMVFFTGDLVHSGKEHLDFENAYNALLKQMSVELNIAEENIILCAGNHDINRDECTKSNTNYFDTLILENSQIENEYSKKTKDYIFSIKPLENYNSFVKKNKNENDIYDDLYSIHVRNFNGSVIGILTLNSSWLSSGSRDDINKLMLPPSIIKDAVNYFNKQKVTHRFILIHHPFNYFKEFNAVELEDLINKEFNLKFTGHIHRENIETKYAGTNGIYTNTTQATLTFENSSEIGYSVINYNTGDCIDNDFDGEQHIVIERATYNRKEARFSLLETVNVSIPCGIEKAKQNKIRRKITEKYRIELSNANELLLDYDSNSKLGFLDLFSPPVLSTKNQTEASTSESKSSYNYMNIFSSEDNLLLFGKDKCGKTSLLKKIQLHYIKNYSSVGIVPFYIDYKELENTYRGTFNIPSLLSTYYNINYSDAETIITKGKLLLLIDNLDTTSIVNNCVIDFLGCNENVRFIVCSDYLASRVYFEELDHLTYNRIYFDDLTRTEIRHYTEKHTNKTGNRNEDVLERITTVCKQLQLPVNYWTISIILLIYKKSNEDYNKNLFGILDMCVDEILQKKQLLFSKNKLTFEQYKELCSKIAHYLLVTHKDNVYSATNLEIITFLDTVIRSNPRLVANAKDIFDYFYTIGLLKEKNGRYTFRLNGIFEYFLAYYLSHHPDFKDEILSTDSIYLSFKNELEIYSGFKRDDEEFVKNIFNKTKSIFDKLITQLIPTNNLDETLLTKYDQSREFANYIKKLRVNNPLKHELQDALKDKHDPLSTQSEVHVKEPVDVNKTTPEILEIYLHILSRVFKNSDNISDTDLIYEIFDYLLNAYCVFGFYLIDQATKQAKKENLEIDTTEEDFVIGEELLKIITNFIPVLTQVLMFDGLGHVSIKKIIETKIDECKIEYSKNQYKLFILYFLLMDIDIKSHKYLIDDVFKFVVSNPLKVSTFTKLNFYLGFKAYKDKSLEDFFKEKIRQAQHRLDNKIADSDINRYLSRKQKRNIIKKNKNK